MSDTEVTQIEPGKPLQHETVRLNRPSPKHETIRLNQPDSPQEAVMWASPATTSDVSDVEVRRVQHDVDVYGVAVAMCRAIRRHSG